MIWVVITVKLGSTMLWTVQSLCQRRESIHDECKSLNDQKNKRRVGLCPRNMCPLRITLLNLYVIVVRLPDNESFSQFNLFVLNRVYLHQDKIIRSPQNYAFNASPCSNVLWAFISETCRLRLDYITINFDNTIHSTIRETVHYCPWK